MYYNVRVGWREEKSVDHVFDSAKKKKARPTCAFMYVSACARGVICSCDCRKNLFAHEREWTFAGERWS